MVTFESIVSIIFRVINFGVLIGLAVYFFRKYAWAMIKQQIMEKRAYIRDLHKQETLLIKEREAVEMAIKDDKKNCKQLKEKVTIWRSSVAQEFEECAQKKIKYIGALQEAAQKRTQEVAAMRLSSLVLPQALDEAYNELQATFADEKTADKFVKRIVDHLRAGKR